MFTTARVTRRTTHVALAFMLLCGNASAAPQSPPQSAAEKIPPAYRGNVAAALERAGENAGELVKAIESVGDSHRPAMCFLVANMPARDLRSLIAEYLCENVELAFKAREDTRWGREIPDELFLNYVLPYASVNERRDRWRKDFFDRFIPVVNGCRTPAEAAQKLNREMFDMVGVKYHATKRPKPDQSPYESMAAGYASCTGLSVLLVDACRAVGIPARIAGTPCWATKNGNHNWVEIWDEQWYFTGAAEPDPQGLNRGWFVADAQRASTADDRHRIYATSFARTPLAFPLAWDLSIKYVKARDVTTFYTHRTQARIRVLDRPGGKPIATEVTVRLDGEIYARGNTWDKTGDKVNSDHASLTWQLPGGKEFAVELRTADGVIAVSYTHLGAHET